MTWKGQAKGGLLGYKIFVFILKTFSLKPAYFILHFAAFYYFLFSNTNRYVFSYFKNILGYGSLKSRIKVYNNYYVFGQTLLDRVALLSGIKTNFKFVRDGGENLDKISKNGKGGILLSAHIGNWEVAGQLLNRLDTKFNILMYENEHENIKKYLDKVMTKRKVNIIPIKDNDLGHLVEVKNAFSNNELLVMHGDRYRMGMKTIETDFMGRKAKFPLGPFVLAEKFRVPVCITFAMKEGYDQYHLFATELIEMPVSTTPDETRRNIEALLNRFVKEMEKMLHRYSDQWFNYYDFWN